ncbi:hypothetical protein [Primorskyibacter flagellatus]|uniref:Uncharacterized protein n=1 Tax=Primorskyibacter flagellatus TaxID=1387277 RepID=A0A1W2E454_9RHOB|nr:hypothetical protein [Primorskyibacter flagellatus]SMD04534.1 hypothetical protein SAMN06295998_12211 [Primorskyibacter flagellatus]
MTEHPKDITAPSSGGEPPSLEERLLKKYGHYLEGEDLSAAQRKECLLALWQIMYAFAEFGFSLKAGEKFTASSDHGMDDVLEYLILEDTAHETVAPPDPEPSKEQP